MLLTPQQLQEIRKIIEDYHHAFIVNTISPAAVTPEILTKLRAKGLVDIRITSIQEAYVYGQLLAHLENPAVAHMTYAQFREFIRKNPIPLTALEKQAIKMAEHSAGQYCVGLGNRVDATTGRTLIEADAKLRAELLDTIKTQTAEAIARRESVQKLASNLGHATGDWARDWRRIANTEVQQAMQTGLAERYREEHGTDVRVAKVPMPDACKECKRLFLGPDGKPRIWRLADLQAFGTNVGRKTRDWVPTVGTVHPHCQCQLIRIPKNFGFDAIGRLVPGGKLGVEADAADFKRSLELEDELHKAVNSGDLIDFQGIPIHIENRAGELRHWESATGERGSTQMLCAYGEVVGSSGTDGDGIDVYVGPDPKANTVYVVHQQNPVTGVYDEEKCMLGFPSEEFALQVYRAHFNKPGFDVAVSPMGVEQFKVWCEATADSQPSEAIRLVIPLQKGGPYVGPRGGMWADPEHTIHWEPGMGEVKSPPAPKSEAKTKLVQGELFTESDLRARAIAETDPALTPEQKAKPPSEALKSIQAKKLDDPAEWKLPAGARIDDPWEPKLVDPNAKWAHPDYGAGTGAAPWQQGEDWHPDLGSYDYIVVNSSGGKDSQCMLTHVVNLCKANNVPLSKIVVVHCDLGRVEWGKTRELAEAQAKHYGVRFEVVQRAQNDLVEQIEERHGDLIQREADVAKLKSAGIVTWQALADASVEQIQAAIGKGKGTSKWNADHRAKALKKKAQDALTGTKKIKPKPGNAPVDFGKAIAWPSTDARYCTSDHKRAEVKKLITKLASEHKGTGKVPRILNALGIRAQESPGREKMDNFEREEETSTRVTDRWYPIHRWHERRVWETIQKSGVPYHQAYALGMRRLSCAFCVFASKEDILIAAKHNPELFKTYLALEEKIGASFRKDLSLADVMAEIQKMRSQGYELNELAEWVKKALGLHVATDLVKAAIAESERGNQMALVSLLLGAAHERMPDAVAVVVDWKARGACIHLDTERDSHHVLFLEYPWAYNGSLLAAVFASNSGLDFEESNVPGPLGAQELAKSDEPGIPAIVAANGSPAGHRNPGFGTAPNFLFNVPIRGPARTDPRVFEEMIEDEAREQQMADARKRRRRDMRIYNVTKPIPDHRFVFKPPVDRAYERIRDGKHKHRQNALKQFELDNSGLLNEDHAFIRKAEGAANPIYYGPRGGKWADPEHTIPWKESKGKPAAGPQLVLPLGKPVQRTPVPAQVVRMHPTSEQDLLAGIKASRQGKSGVLPVLAKIGDQEIMADMIFIPGYHKLSGKEVYVRARPGLVRDSGAEWVVEVDAGRDEMESEQEYTDRVRAGVMQQLQWIADPDGAYTGPVARGDSLEKAEQIILSQSVEHGLFVVDGKVAHRFQGTRSECALHPEVLKTMQARKGAVFTHNHPASGPDVTLSHQDIIVAVVCHLSAMRAVSKDGTVCDLKAPESGWGSKEDREDLIRQLNQASKLAAEKAHDEMDDVIRAVGGTPGSTSSFGYSEEKWHAIYSQRAFEEINKVLADFYGPETQLRRTTIGGSDPGAGDRPGQGLATEVRKEKPVAKRKKEPVQSTPGLPDAVKASIHRGLGKAIADNLMRLEHGMPGPKGQRASTAYSSFVVDNETGEWLPAQDAWDQGKFHKGTLFHSHLGAGDAHKGGTTRDSFSTGAGDVWSFIKNLRTKGQRYDGVITGWDPSTKEITYDMLIAPPKGSPLPSLAQVKKETEASYAERAEAWDKHKISSEEFYRIKLRKFAEKWGFTYIEDMKTRVSEDL